MNDDQALSEGIAAFIKLFCKSTELVSILDDARRLPDSRIDAEIADANRALSEWWAAMKSVQNAMMNLHAMMELKTVAPVDAWTVRVGAMLDDMRGRLLGTDPSEPNARKLRRPMPLDFTEPMKGLEVEFRRLRAMRDNPKRAPEFTQTEYAAISEKTPVQVNRMVKQLGAGILTKNNARLDRAEADRAAQQRGSKTANKKTAKAKAKAMWFCPECGKEWPDDKCPDACPAARCKGAKPKRRIA